jgi:hypothetical protein
MAASQHSRVQWTVNGQLASILWDARDIIFIDYLEKGQTINSGYYMALLEHLNDEIKQKRPHLKKKSAVSSRQCTMSKINQNDNKIHHILQI